MGIVREMNTSRSTIQPYGTHESHCGYCNHPDDTSISYGIVSTKMFSQDYEKLMLRGWRRSGTYFYKPRNIDTCCPLYTIRTDVSKFVASKAQRQVERRFDRYLNTSSSNGVSHSFTMETVKPVHTTERHELYKKYQIAIHNDKEEDITELKFTRFLVQSPLIDSSTSTSSTSATNSDRTRLPYGTYHQLYRIDGCLVALGVVDLLPSGLSSVYLAYDPDYRHLALGKYTALCELKYCRKHELSYYYMGFYSHRCEKMKYKADLSPSELLCPTTYEWFEFVTVCKPKLDVYKFAPFHPDVFSRFVETRGLNSSQSVVASASVSHADEESTNSSGVNSSGMKNLSTDDQVMKLPFLPVTCREPERVVAAVESAWLDIRAPKQAHIAQLRAEGQKVVRPILQEWIEMSGSDLVDSFIVQF